MPKIKYFFTNKPLLQSLMTRFLLQSGHLAEQRTVREKSVKFFKDQHIKKHKGAKKAASVNFKTHLDFYFPTMRKPIAFCTLPSI